MARNIWNIAIEFEGIYKPPHFFAGPAVRNSVKNETILFDAALKKRV